MKDGTIGCTGRERTFSRVGDLEVVETLLHKWKVGRIRYRGR